MEKMLSVCKLLLVQEESAHEDGWRERTEPVLKVAKGTEKQCQ